MQTVPIKLNSNQSTDRLVLRGARLAFKALRAITAQAKQAPGVVAQAAADIRAAWADTRPKA